MLNAERGAGARLFEMRYSVGRSEAGSRKMIVRRALVKVLLIVIRDRVPFSVANVWVRKE